MGEREVPARLPRTVWPRDGEPWPILKIDGYDTPVCIATGRASGMPVAHEFVGGGWLEADRQDEHRILAAWAMAERDARVKAEAERAAARPPVLGRVPADLAHWQGPPRTVYGPVALNGRVCVAVEYAETAIPYAVGDDGALAIASHPLHGQILGAAIVALSAERGALANALLKTQHEHGKAETRATAAEALAKAERAYRVAEVAWRVAYGAALTDPDRKHGADEAWRVLKEREADLSAAGGTP